MDTETLGEPESEAPMTRYRGVIPSTGEVIDIDAPAVRGRRRKARRRIFALADMGALSRLEMTGREWDLFFAMAHALNAETNEARITIAEMAEHTGMQPSNAAKVIGTLRDRRIIITLRRGVHRINAHLLFRGSNIDWDAVAATEREPLWRR